MSSKCIYYVYAYLREKDSKTAKAGTPYYIGKGKNRRLYEKHTVPKPKNIKCIILLEQHLTELGAIAIERRLIKWFGRKDSGTGILMNQTDGGEGWSGHIGKPRSVETRNKISKAQKGKIISEDCRKKISEANTGKLRSQAFKDQLSQLYLGKKKGPFSDEHKQNISKAKKGIPLSEEIRKALSMSLKGKPKPKRTVEHSKKISLANKGKRDIDRKYNARTAKK